MIASLNSHIFNEVKSFEIVSRNIDPDGLNGAEDRTYSSPMTFDI